MTTIGGVRLDRSDPRQVACGECAEAMMAAANRLGYPVTKVDADFENGSVSVRVDLTRRAWPPAQVPYPGDVQLARDDEVETLAVEAPK